mmetsp:Transcript_14704/g.28280  ORF Transcript_14704/g.28280 Transcript_14704/m.28280 type:complete len:232 (+) Transcript_14704:2020-2715(+)
MMVPKLWAVGSRPLRFISSHVDTAFCRSPSWRHTSSMVLNITTSGRRSSSSIVSRDPAARSPRYLRRLCMVVSQALVLRRDLISRAQAWASAARVRALGATPAARMAAYASNAPDESPRPAHAVTMLVYRIVSAFSPAAFIIAGSLNASSMRPASLQSATSWVYRRLSRKPQSAANAKASFSGTGLHLAHTSKNRLYLITGASCVTVPCSFSFFSSSTISPTSPSLTSLKY